jgi:hypothetical protein
LLANLYQRCFGGDKTPWSSAYPPNSYDCGYGTNGMPDIGGFYWGASPTDPINAPHPHEFDFPYGPYNGHAPFNAYVNIDVKL